MHCRLAFATTAREFLPLIPAGFVPHDLFIIVSIHCSTLLCREKLFALAGLFSSLLQDSHFRVRRLMSKAVLVLFDIFDTPFADIRAKLSPAIEQTSAGDWTEAEWVTAIDTLVSTARQSLENEKPILLLLCETHERINAPDLRQYLRRRLEALAMSFGYKCVERERDLQCE